MAGVNKSSRSIWAGWGVSDPIGAPDDQDLPQFDRSGSYLLSDRVVGIVVQVLSLGHKGLSCAQRSPAERERLGLIGIIP